MAKKEPKEIKDKKEPKGKKDRKELDEDLIIEINTNDSLEARIETLLVQILRELKRLK